jgi:hypothetical protein
MFIQKNKFAFVQADTFPDTVTQYKVTVKYRDFCFIARVQLTVYVDFDVRIAFVIGIFVSAFGHAVACVR